MSSVILKQNDALATAIGTRSAPSTSTSSSHTVTADNEVVPDDSMDIVGRKVRAVSQALNNLYSSFNMEAPHFNSPKGLVTAALDLLDDPELTEECSRAPLLSRLDILLTKGFKISGV